MFWLFKGKSHGNFEFTQRGKFFLHGGGEGLDNRKQTEYTVLKKINLEENKMKKILKTVICVFFAFVICFSFTACSSKNEAINLVNNALTNYSESRAYSYIFDMQMISYLDAEPNEMNTRMKMTIDKDAQKLFIEMSSDEIFDMGIYYVDGFLYTKMGEDYKIKTATPAEEFFGGLDTDELTNMDFMSEIAPMLELLNSFPDSMFSITKKSDGSSEVKIHIAASEQGMTIEETLTFIVSANGSLKRIYMRMYMSGYMEMVLNVEFDYSSAISFPVDLDTYSDTAIEE